MCSCPALAFDFAFEWALGGSQREGRDQAENGLSRPSGVRIAARTMLSLCLPARRIRLCGSAILRLRSGQALSAAAGGHTAGQGHLTLPFAFPARLAAHKAINARRKANAPHPGPVGCAQARTAPYQANKGNAVADPARFAPARSWRIGCSTRPRRATS